MGEGLARCQSYARRVQRGTQLEWGGRAMSSGLGSTRAIAVSERRFNRSPAPVIENRPMPRDSSHEHTMTYLEIQLESTPLL